jgi:hypothetical protein
MKKQIPLLLLAAIAVLSIMGLVKVMNAETTGQYTYAGGQIQYDVGDVCTQVQCKQGEAELVRIDGSEYSPGFMLAGCACPEAPGILYTVKFIKPVQSYGY